MRVCRSRCPPVGALRDYLAGDSFSGRGLYTFHKTSPYYFPAKAPWGDFGEWAFHAQNVDGVNVIDFGFVTGFVDSARVCENALACTYFDVRQPNLDVILEVDVRLNSRYLFYSRRTDPQTRKLKRIAPSKCRAAIDPPNNPECYDVWGVVAHEAGHSLGLDHSPDRTQTMADGIEADPDTRKLRTLGSGDVAGFQTLYPAP